MTPEPSDVSSETISAVILACQVSQKLTGEQDVPWLVVATLDFPDFEVCDVRFGGIPLGENRGFDA